jgi:hypothetical protein
MDMMPDRLHFSDITAIMRIVASHGHLPTYNCHCWLNIQEIVPASDGAESAE